jgi:SAM-dependent methyltransferase
MSQLDAGCPTPVCTADRVGMDALAHFDRVAAIYRPMEYLSFGPLLERCRFWFVPELAAARGALLLGDGDGRFAARLLAAAPDLHVHAVDASPAMLRRLRARAMRLGAAARLTATCADIRSFTPSVSGSRACDLVATHFFLDCLTPDEANALALRLRPHLAPGALWVVSEFEVPAAGPMRAAFGRLTIAGLYAAFRVLTGLRVRQIPPWRNSLACAGFVRRSSRSWLGGLLVSELWQLP